MLRWPRSCTGDTTAATSTHSQCCSWGRCSASQTQDFQYSWNITINTVPDKKPTMHLQPLRILKAAVLIYTTRVLFTTTGIPEVQKTSQPAPGNHCISKAEPSKASKQHTLRLLCLNSYILQCCAETAHITLWHYVKLITWDMIVFHLCNHYTFP